LVGFLPFFHGFLKTFTLWELCAPLDKFPRIVQGLTMVELVYRAGPGPQIGLPWLAGRINERTTRGIALTLAFLIRDGEVPPGTQLPPIRTLAAELSVSPSTVSAAWARLRAERLVGTGRRRGTVVLPLDQQRPGNFPGWATIDLEQGSPDPTLLPPLEDAVAAAVRTATSSSRGAKDITPRLLAAVASTWPFRPEAWTVVGGGAEGGLLACRAVARPGDLVALEEPAAPRLLGNLRKAQARILPVRRDREGPKPQSLAEALRHHPVAFLYRPRSPVLSVHPGSPGRAAELADVLEANGPGAAVVEYDELGPLAEVSPPSIGTHLPTRVLHVRSYCAAYGPELRSCVVAGAGPLVERVRRLRDFGTVWAGRVLQDAQAFLLDDPLTGRLLRQARQRYAQRQNALSAALCAEGVDVLAQDGLMLWIPVENETRALIRLATVGVSLAPGSRCFVRPPAGQHLRIATSRLPDDPRHAVELASLVAVAARQ
jgi:DNA-binding transcriptional MocR family regulator